MSNLRAASAGRIKKPRPRRSYVNAATLEPVVRLAVEAVLQGTADSSKRVAIAAQMDMARDDITPENVTTVMTIFLLRLEGEGTAQVRESRLRSAIAGIRAQLAGERNCACADAQAVVVPCAIARALE